MSSLKNVFERMNTWLEVNIPDADGSEISELCDILNELNEAQLQELISVKDKNHRLTELLVKERMPKNAKEI